MQISIPIDCFNENNILFCNRTENTVINGGGFYRIMYCNPDISMLGVHITFDVDMTVGDTTTGRLDIREALIKITPSVVDVITRLTSIIHRKWQDIYGPKTISYHVTPHSVEPAILKALLQARNTMNSHQITPVVEQKDSESVNGLEDSETVCHSKVIRMPFVFKCAGVYDTDDELGVSFRLNSVTHR